MAKEKTPELNIEDLSQLYPLSKGKKIKGNRRLVREKVVQTIVAYRICDTDIGKMIKHIFYREFNFGEDEEPIEKLLRPDEIYELEADIPIEWTEDELLFGKTLIYKTINNSEELDAIIEEFAKNWELERVALVDKIILQVALTEFLEFPEIPPKVSINEAIDIAKKYSTEKSKVFVNGVLDAILDKFKAENKLNKSGKGLLDK